MVWSVVARFIPCSNDRDVPSQRVPGGVDVAHEMAHSLGLNHGSSDYDDDNWKNDEYGDSTDTCGAGLCKAPDTCPGWSLTCALPHHRASTALG